MKKMVADSTELETPMPFQDQGGGETPPRSGEDAQGHRAGHVAIFGEPNAGKSTLLNTILGEKVAIVSPKPQTTRDRIVGILPRPAAQIAFVDTPGWHRPRGTRLNAVMVSQALGAIEDVDVIVLLMDAARQVARQGGALAEGDLQVLGAARRTSHPVVLALNKIDRVDKPLLLPVLDAWRCAWDGFVDYFPLSARTGEGVEPLLGVLESLLPVGPSLYPEDQLTDRPLRFLAAELVREQLLLQLGQELPYSVAVEVEVWEEEETLVRILIAIHVEKTSQKRIVVGRAGRQIKQVGIAARAQLEALVAKRVYLESFVRVEEDWTERDRALKRFGYEMDPRGKTGGRPAGRRKGGVRT